MPSSRNSDDPTGSVKGRAPLCFDIETIGPEAAELLARLHAQCFDTPWDSATFAQLLGQPTSRAWLGRPEQPGGETPAPLSFAVLSAVGDEAEILTIGVVPAARKTGAGRALLAAILADLAALGATRVFLEVAVSNTAAIALYSGAGFSRIGTRKNYLKVGGKLQDAHLMRAVLGSKFRPI